MATAQLSIYKLDTDKIDVQRYLRKQKTKHTASNIEAEPSIGTYVEAVVDKHNSDIQNNESSGTKYEPVTQGAIQQIDNTFFHTYHSIPEDKEHRWNKLFPSTLGLDNVIHENVVSFYEVERELFAISSGHSLSLFEQYIDEAFPIEVAQRIMHPEPKSANERIIAGNIYGRTQSFRRQQAISASRSINSVWQSIGGTLTEDTALSSIFTDLFPRKTREVNAEFSGSVLIKKALEFDKLPAYTKWLLKLESQELTATQKASFSYLHSLIRVSSRRNRALVKRLEIAYTEYLLNTSIEDYEYNIDFAHTDYSKFVLAQTFELRADRESEVFAYEDVYSGHPASYIVNKLRKIIGETISELDSEGVYELIKSSVKISAQSGDVIHDIHAPFLSFFHGEFDFENRKFFRVDGQWYEASTDFIATVKKEFAEIITNGYISDASDIDDIPLNPIENTEEAPYNQLYDIQPDCIVTDKVEVEGIELADVIRFRDQGIELYHNKLKFGASMRDVRSQLSLSMALIDRILDSKEDGRKILESYYDTLKRKYATGEYKTKKLTLKFEKEEFITKFLETDAKKLTFILGCLDDKTINIERKSSIAKYELIGFCKVDPINYGFNVKVIRIGRGK